MDKKSKIILGILIILVVCLIGVNVFLTPSSVKSNENHTITDMANRSVSVPTSVSKVVSTSPPITTILYMIAPDKLGGMNFQWTDDELKYVQCKNIETQYILTLGSLEYKAFELNCMMLRLKRKIELI